MPALVLVQEALETVVAGVAQRDREREKDSGVAVVAATLGLENPGGALFELERCRVLLIARARKTATHGRAHRLRSAAAARGIAPGKSDEAEHDEVEPDDEHNGTPI